jgi:hypothetical protein
MDDTDYGWCSFQGGASVGQIGCEGGAIVLDEEHADGARITLERGGAAAPFAITCGIYDWLVHTRFFDTEDGAKEAFQSMEMEMVHILRLIPDQANFDFDRDGPPVIQAIGNFVERFP